jgi:hypothetical protein
VQLARHVLAARLVEEIRHFERIGAEPAKAPGYCSSAVAENEEFVAARGYRALSGPDSLDLAEPRRRT